MITAEKTSVLSIAALGISLISASPAFASGAGSCDSGEACLYYSPGYVGGFFGDGSGDTQSYENYTYNSYYLFGGCNNGSCGGDGQYVRNNAASIYNTNSSDSVMIYYSPNFGGPSQRFYPNSGGNLISTLRNNNASQCFDFYGVCPGE